jgi:hypothetical protein
MDKDFEKRLKELLEKSKRLMEQSEERAAQTLVIVEEYETMKDQRQERRKKLPKSIR